MTADSATLQALDELEQAYLIQRSLVLLSGVQRYKTWSRCPVWANEAWADLEQPHTIKIDKKAFVCGKTFFSFVSSRTVSKRANVRTLKFPCGIFFSTSPGVLLLVLRQSNFSSSFLASHQQLQLNYLCPCMLLEIGNPKHFFFLLFSGSWNWYV